ncbi:MAG: nitroreductase [Spirochaetes bacterium]|nr:MAG: nitroreductase [Spirochaetota bacterium]
MFENIRQAYLPETNFPVVTIDYGKCKKCGRCSDQCPTFAIESGADKLPRVRGFGGFEQTCFNCWNCVSVCPHDAIRIQGAHSIPGGRYKTRLLGKVEYPDPLRSGGVKPYQEFESQLTGVERVIYTRRSCRLFKDKAVPRETIERILEAGRFAPSAGNSQPYRFAVITDRGIIAELERQSMKMLRQFKDLYLDSRGKKRWWKNILFTLLSLAKVNSIDPRPVPAIEKSDKNGDRLYFNAPAVILIFKNSNGIGNPDLDAGICSQNMALAANSLGLGSCHITFFVEPMKSKGMSAMRRRLGISYPWVPVNSIAIGYPKGTVDGVVKRDTPPSDWFTGD